MSTTQSLGVNRLDAMIGFQALSLSNLTTASEPQIKSGSVVEVNGALFEFTADESITGWADINAGNTVYILLTPSGTPGSQTLAASFTKTAPAWDNAKQGYYTGTARAVAWLWKNSASEYSGKVVFTPFTRRQRKMGYFRQDMSLTPTTSYILDLDATMGLEAAFLAPISTGNLLGGHLSVLNDAGTDIYSCGINGKTTVAVSLAPSGDLTAYFYDGQNSPASAGTKLRGVYYVHTGTAPTTNFNDGTVTRYIITIEAIL